jgi:hypothetical protein
MNWLEIACCRAGEYPPASLLPTHPLTRNNDVEQSIGVRPFAFSISRQIRSSLVPTARMHAGQPRPPGAKPIAEVLPQPDGTCGPRLN